MLSAIFFLIFLAFVLYGAWRWYGTTDPTKPVAERIWLAVVAAATSLGAALVQWFHSTP